MRTRPDPAVSDGYLRWAQVVLAWLIGGELPVVPLIGASSVAQLDESLAAVDLQLSAEQRQLLDEAS